MKRTRDRIALEIAIEKGIAITFYLCGDFNNYDTHAIAYPSGKIKWFNTSACTMFGANKKEKEYMIKEREKFVEEKNSIEHFEYCGCNLKNYEF